MKYSRMIIGLGFLLPLLYSCERIEYFEERPVMRSSTMVLAHAASGDHPDYRRNTLSAAKIGFMELDGIEIDVSFSKDNSLWVTHDKKVSLPEGESAFISRTSDARIREILDENGNPYYHRLDEILSYMSRIAPSKIISLDVKKPHSLFPESIYEEATRQIDSMVMHLGLQGKVLVESENTSFLCMIEAAEGNIQGYYLCYGNFEKGIAEAYRNNLSGISFHYNRDDELPKEGVQLAQSLGLKIITYYINDDLIPEVYQLGVDFIQTDDLDFYSTLNRQ